MNMVMKNSEQQRWRQHRTTIALLLAYLTFGALHEFAHFLTAAWLIPPASSLPSVNLNDNIPILILRILLGRCITIPFASSANDDSMTISVITHSGWIFSVTIAILCHLLYKFSILKSPIFPLAAYITAMEGMATDLFGFVPHQQHSDSWLSNGNSHNYLTFFCGNFGILLLNPSWLSIDGGRTALDVLEKMVSVVSSLSLSLRVIVGIISGAVCAN
jgi:hypothetical protein